MNALICEGAVRIEAEGERVVGVGVYVSHVPDQSGPIAVVLREVLCRVVVVLQRSSGISLHPDGVASSHLPPCRSHQVHRYEVERPYPDLAEIVAIQCRDC